jgi:hypothetical protein
MFPGSATSLFCRSAAAIAMPIFHRTWLPGRTDRHPSLPQMLDEVEQLVAEGRSEDEIKTMLCISLRVADPRGSARNG